MTPTDFIIQTLPATQEAIDVVGGFVAGAVGFCLCIRVLKWFNK